MDTPTYIELNQYRGNEAPHLSASQQFLAPYTANLTSMWAALWCAVAIYMLSVLVRAYMDHRANKR